MTSLHILQTLATEYADGQIRDLVFEIQYRLGCGVRQAEQLANVIRANDPIPEYVNAETAYGRTVDISFAIRVF